MPHPLQPLLVARRQRITGDDWDTATSWFGGRPRLGSHSWPRDAKSGVPMVFVAQISLDEIAPHAKEFPTHGSLAFFLGAFGSGDGAVLHVTNSSSQRPNDPPGDAPPVREVCGWPFQEDSGPGSELLFPYWPVHLTPLGDVAQSTCERGTDEEADRERLRAALSEAIDGLYGRRRYFLTAKEAFASCGLSSHPHWWHSAFVLSACLQNAIHRAPNIQAVRAPWLAKARADLAAIVAKSKPTFGFFGRRSVPPGPELLKAQKALERLEAQDQAYHRDLPALKDLASQAAAFAAGRKPADPMRAEDWDVFSVLFSRARGELVELTRHSLPVALDGIETETLIYLLTADDAAYQALPEPIRNLVNQSYLLPTREYCHQVFGAGVDIQGAAVWDNADKHLLLQLVYDDMMHWRFGDMGAYQFWISPEDVKARNWSAASLTFECH